MRTKITLNAFLPLLVFLFSTLSLYSQKRFVEESLWSAVSEKEIPLTGTRYILPTQYKTFKLNLNQFRTVTGIAPMEFTPVAQYTKTYLELPMPDGSLKTFDIVESPIMDPELAAKFPDITTYAGYAVDDKNIMVRFDLTLQGFHAMIMIPGESTIYIDPYRFGGGDMEHYIVYHKKDFRSSINKNFECSVSENYKSIDQNHQPDLKAMYGSCELRTYRLALAATAEYTAFHGGTVALALSAQVTTMNRINAVYGREMAIRMNIVANNNLIIYTNATTDPYTNNNGATMLNQNQTNLTTVIGGANYDIGHVFSTGGGGIAQLGSVCNATGKARGVTGSPSPVGDPFDIDYVAHEMGHQFGCNHTFNNSDDGSCAGNTNTTTSMEPGSGSTIMAYAGICNPSNVQSNSNDYFHTISLQEMGAFITGAGHTCPVKTALSNSNPSVTANAATVVVPQGTPFFLTATGTDPNATNTLTYCWEQTNTGTATTSPSATATAGANFRSFNPTTNTTRYFPNLTSLAANGPYTWEVLPTVTRTMNFRVTVRDNATGGGCTEFANSTVSVTNTSGPFSVTVPSATGITWTGATTQNVTWNVASTTNAPVSCANVDILISTDGGLTYTVVLANTPNDGTQAITVPNTPSTTARVMVRCAGGNFFDISNNNFTIIASTFDYTLSVTNTSVSVCPPNNAVFNITSTAIGGFANPITLSVTGVPAGGTATFGTNPLTPGNGTTLTISGTGSIATGTYNLTLTGNSTSGTKTVSLTLTISSGAPATVTLLSPANAATNVNTPTAFSWTAATGTGVVYAIAISSNPSMTPIVDQATGLSTPNYNSAALSPSSTYYWRVTASNGCGTAPTSTQFSFTTGISGCDTISNYDTATDTARIYRASGSWGYLAGHNGYGDLAKADKYTYAGTNTHLKGAYFGFGRAFTTNATRTFNARVWDGTTGAPTTVLATVPVTYQSIQTLIAGGSNVAYINFGSVPLPASKIFFVGIEFTYNGDTIALITNSVGQTTPATAWEKFSDGTTWVPYDNAASWGVGLAHYIFPILGTPTDANFTPLNPSVCTGSTLAFTNTSLAAATYSWTATGGTPASSTAANPSFSYTAPGTYTVRLISTNDCMSDTASTTVTARAVSNTLTTVNISCNGGSNGSISTTPTGGIAPYTYIWSNGRTTASNTGLAAGTYTVTISDANGCSTTSSATITQPTTALNSTISAQVNVSCFGGANGSATVVGTGGTSPFNYLWSNGRTTSSNTGLTAGTYNLTVTDANSCTSTRTITITQPSTALSASIASTINPSCSQPNGGSIISNATGGTAGYTYIWSNGRTTSTNTGLSSGIYSLTVTDANSCTAVISATLTQPSGISVTSNSSSVSCNGGNNGTASVTVNGGTAPYTYLWSNGNATPNNTGLSAGSYVVTVSDNAGCTNFTTVTVSQPLVISSTVTNLNNISCFGLSNGTANVVAAGGTSPFNYIWSNGRTTSNNSALSAGTYTVTITDANACTATRSVTITQPSSALNASINSTVNPTCNGSANGSISTSVSGGTSGYSYLWSNGSTIANLSNLVAGTYNLTVTDVNGCSTTTSSTLSQPTALFSNISSTAVSCNGGNNATASVNATGGNAPLTYLWSNGNNSSNINGLSAGTYTVTVTDANGCTVTNSVSVGQPTALNATISSTPESCVGNNGSASLSINGGTPGYTYIWSNGSTTSSINGINAGNYTVTVSDANACTTVSSVNVAYACVSCTLSGSATGVNVTCFGVNNGVAVAVSSGGTAPINYSWSNSAGNSSSINGLSPGVYSVTMTDALNCTATASVTVSGPSQISVTANSTNPTTAISNDGSINLTVNGGTTPYNFSWSNAAITQNISGLGNGLYTVTVTDNNGCSQILSTTLSSPTGLNPIEEVERFIILPNPNEGIFQIQIDLSEFQDITLTMYDVLGRNLYESNLSGKNFTIPMEMYRLSAGTYFINIQSKNTSKTQKLIISK